jgi:histidine triad (HIT) family protein
VVAGGESEWNSQTDVIYRDAETTAFVSPKWWNAAPAHVLVVPNDHHQDVYAIDDDALAAVYRTAKVVAAAIRSAYDCDGTSMRQHNEVGGGQDVSHFHVHVFPRRAGDRLYERNGDTRRTAADERAPFAQQLRTALKLS